MKKILIVSDTHGNIENFKKVIQLEKPDIKIHAGDFCVDINIIKNNFDFLVAGNNDFEGERVLKFQIFNFNFVLLHGDIFGYYSQNNVEEFKNTLFEYAIRNQADVLITGHTHIELVDYQDNILLLNPGSLVYPRNKNHICTYAILEVDENKIKSVEQSEIIKKFEDLI
ncbi:MAG: YfcE family phosphodiesterase [Malacoplasma sp.]|nr:YfcE family phosphodiesterase [Malacoplasma sp.]